MEHPAQFAAPNEHIAYTEQANCESVNSIG